MRLLRTVALGIAGIAMIGFLAALAFTGRPPGSDVGHFDAAGIVPAAPEAVVRVELVQGKDRWAFRREGAKAWAFDGRKPSTVPDTLASHLESGLRFLHVSSPSRSLEPEGYRGASFADFQLDPPATVVSLATGDGVAAVVDFGALNPSGTSQYARMIGRPTLYLLPRYVGSEWQLAADMARRLAPTADTTAVASRSEGLLLPVSIEQIWAVELVTGGALHRFERDGAGNWFLHVGQHSHGGGPAHVADPVKAPIIAAALGAFDQTRIEAVAARQPSGDDLDRFGLVHPGVIALMYARDNSTPVARVEIGNMSNDGFARFARLSRDGDVVKIAGYEAERLIRLLKAVGVAS